MLRWEIHKEAKESEDESQNCTYYYKESIQNSYSYCQRAPLMASLVESATGSLAYGNVSNPTRRIVA